MLFCLGTGSLSLILLLLCAGTRADDKCDCGGRNVVIKPGDLGNIASPNYPNSNECGTTDCTWVLTAGGPPITLEFQDGLFDLEAGYDYLMIYDGYTLVSRCTGSYCGSVTSTGPTLMLVFTKDDSDSADFHGFFGDFHVANSQPRTSTTMSPTCVCGPSTVLLPENSAYGTVRSPGFPSDYCGNMNCVTTLYTPGSRIGISFPMFDVANDDHLYIYDGRDTYGSLLARCTGWYCGNVTGSSEFLTLQFNTNSYNSANGCYYQACVRCGLVRFRQALFFPAPATTTPSTTTSTGAPPGSCVTCYDLYQRGYGDGVYTLYLWDSDYWQHVRVDAYCWSGHTTIFQRVDGAVSFEQDWDTYVEGFGDVEANGNYWLGNSNIHRLTMNCGPQQVRFDMADCSGDSAYEQYSQFQVANENANFQVSISLGSGSAGDALHYDSPHYMTGMNFSTYDVDNDQYYSGNCAASNGDGGWWWNRCADVYLTNVYQSNCNGGLYWYNWGRLSNVTMSVISAYAVEP